MFRPMRRFKQQLTQEECVEILSTEVRGVLSVLGDDDYPYGIPIDFYYNQQENKIYFHGAKEGHKIDSIKKYNKVSFCVYDKGYKKEDHWALYFKSVIVFGKIKIVEDFNKAVEICRNLSLKFTKDTSEIDIMIEKYAKNVMCLELTCEHITGKRVTEK